jgi:hypothetical protein
VRAAAQLLVCAAAACGGDRVGPPLPQTPVRLPCALAADAGHANGIRMVLEGALDRAAAGGPRQVGAMFAEAPGTVDDVLGLASRRDPVRIATVVTCPDAPFLLGRGVVTDLSVGLASAVDESAGERDELRSVILRGAYADWSDGWKIHVTPPRDVFSGNRVHAVDAHVWASIARRWATVDVTITATSDDDRLVLLAPPIEAPVADRHAPLHSGFRLVVATVDGRPADLVLGAGNYLVIGGVGDRPARIRLRYEGPLPLVGDNQAEARMLALHRWLPLVPYGAPPPVRVSVHHPPHETLIASLPSAGESTIDDAGWRVEPIAGTTDRDPSLVLLDRRPTIEAWDDGRGNRVEIVADAAPAIDRCAPALGRIVEALAPLGPIGKVRVVAVPAVYGRHGRRADDLIVLFADKLLDLCTPIEATSAPATRRRHADAVALVAHELAHGWFGRAIRAGDDEAGAWYEAASEYVATWAVDAVAATAIRTRWHDDYTDQAHRDLFAVAHRVPTTGALRDALSYGKGALILTALEDRIGRDRVAATLRYLIASRGGSIGSWLDVVTAVHAVAGSRDADWLHRWVFAVGAPELRVSAVRAERGGVAVTIVQDGDPPFEATVDVAVLGGDEVLTFARVPVSGTRTTVTLDRPPTADRISVDPWHRLPRFGVAEAALP